MYGIPAATKRKIVLIIFLSVVCVVLTMYLHSQQSARRPVSVSEESSRGSEANETVQPSLKLTNTEQLESVLPRIADTIPDKLLQYHYTHTRHLERSATILGKIVRKGDTYTMTVEFTESSTKYTVLINVINYDTQDYRLNIRGQD